MMSCSGTGTFAFERDPKLRAHISAPNALYTLEIECGARILRRGLSSPSTNSLGAQISHVGLRDDGVGKY